MDTSKEDKASFLRITSVLGLSESEIVQPGALSPETVHQVRDQYEFLPNFAASFQKRELIVCNVVSDRYQQRLRGSRN